MKPAFLFFLQLLICIYVFPDPQPVLKGKMAAGMEIRAALADTGSKTDPFLADLLKKYPGYFDNILLNRDRLKVQVIYTRIDRDAANNPFFWDYYFNVNPANYFYPASTVKLPVVLLAFQKLNELKLPGLNKYSTLVTEKKDPGQTPVYNDPFTPDGRPTVDQYAKRIFLQSDNNAFNRLYEFLGQEYINHKLHQMGYFDAAILHRLSVPVSEDGNRRSNPITFFDSAGRMLYQQPQIFNQQPYVTRNDRVGDGYYDNEGVLYPGPMDFSQKNRLSLEDLHQLLRSIIFPLSVPQKQRFNLTEEDYRVLYQYMSEYPRESKYPPCDSTNRDVYLKYIYWGAEKTPPPTNIRIFNKVGGAYGFMTDVVYFADFKNHIEFMLSATIYCNSDGILNDDRYDYDSLGMPFMKNLGRVIYEYESKRNKMHIPELSRFRVTYK
jgi:Beta-lactamase enzyme family